MRKLCGVLATAAACAAFASPAVADNTGEQPPGPPFISGHVTEDGNGAVVFHCGVTPFDDSHGAVAANKNQIAGGGCR